MSVERIERKDGSVVWRVCWCQGRTVWLPERPRREWDDSDGERRPIREWLPGDLAVADHAAA